MSKTRLDSVVGEILAGELLFPTGKDCKKLDDENENENKNEEAQGATTKATMDIPPAAHKNSIFPRVLSAPQLYLFEADEEGPKLGQMSRGIGVQEEHLLPLYRREVFYVYPEHDLDEEYKERVDYDNPVLLRSKPKPNESQPVRGLLPSLQDFLKSGLKTHSENDEHAQGREPGISFDFAEYRKAVMENSLKRSVFGMVGRSNK